MPTTHPRNVNAVYESLAALANRRDGPTPITNDEYYPAHAELICWKDEFELAERIAAAHPLNPVGAYERLLERVYRRTEAQARKIDELANWYGEPGVEEFTSEGFIELDFSPEDGIRYTFCVTPAGEVS